MRDDPLRRRLSSEKLPRGSHLPAQGHAGRGWAAGLAAHQGPWRSVSRTPARGRSASHGLARLASPRVDCRSEEHTSELQSRSDLVCRLLLEKKKTKATR